jgi:hypothetical protein
VAAVVAEAAGQVRRPGSWCNACCTPPHWCLAFAEFALVVDPARPWVAGLDECDGEAAARIGAISDKTAMALTVCAASGLAFYLALGIILVKFIVAMATAIVALGSVVFSWAGAGLLVEEAAVNTGLIIGAITTLVALLGAQATQMSVLHGEAGDGGVFSGGRWPTAVTGDFSDATVTDGTASWSIQR